MKKWLSYYTSYFSECFHHQRSTENALCALRLYPWKHFKAINNMHRRRNVVVKRQLSIRSRATGQIHFRKLQGTVQILWPSCNCVLSTITCSKWAISQGQEICFCYIQTVAVMDSRTTQSQRNSIWLGWPARNILRGNKHTIISHPERYHSAALGQFWNTCK